MFLSSVILNKYCHMRGFIRKNSSHKADVVWSKYATAIIFHTESEFENFD